MEQISYLMVFEYVLFPIILFCLYFSWSDINTRWLFIIMLFIELLDELVLGYSRQWGNLFFVWGMFIDVLFIFLITFRKYVAFSLSICHRSVFKSFFRKAYFRHLFSLQEGALIGVYVMAFIVSFVTLFEGVLYYNWIIDSTPIRSYIFRGAMFILHILTGLAAIALALKTHQNSNE